MKIRGFEIVSKYDKQITLDDSKGGGIKIGENEIPFEIPFKMPFRGTSGAAGYDIVNNTGATIILEPGATAKITTYLKSYMLGDEVLSLVPRSSHGFKYLVRLANTVGIIDSDYYDNIDNEGEIFLKITNPERSGKILTIPHGEGMCQGIFSKVLFTDDDIFTKGPVREGGIGSTTVIVDEK